MKTLLSITAAFLIGFTPAFAENTQIGKVAPEFSLPGSDGSNHSLEEYNGKIVVLEWFNPGCPFIEKHYHSGNMQKLQSKAAEDGVVWLTIDSSAEGKQGHLTPDEATELIKKEGIKSTAFLLDPKGEVGKRYGARTTPHMFVIDQKGVLVYDGALDSKATTEESDIATATNYVTQAIAELSEGKKVSTPSTEPYGCGIKYAD